MQVNFFCDKILIKIIIDSLHSLEFVYLNLAQFKQQEKRYIKKKLHANLFIYFFFCDKDTVNLCAKKKQI